MPSLGSFSAIKLKSAYYLQIQNIRRDNRTLYFQFDTGAAITLIGLNSICDDDMAAQERLKEILLDEIYSNDIRPLSETPKTVTKESVEVYPCRMDGISIMRTAPITFYFYIYLGEINMPLLGVDHTDGFSYHHSANGNIEVLSIPKDSGRERYPQNVIEFDAVMERYLSL